MTGKGKGGTEAKTAPKAYLSLRIYKAKEDRWLTEVEAKAEGIMEDRPTKVEIG